MSAGRNWSEALGLGCRDRGGSRYLPLQGVSKKKFGKFFLLGAVARLRGVAGGKGSRWEFCGRPEVSGAV